MQRILIAVLCLLVAFPAWTVEPLDPTTTRDVGMPVDQLKVLIKPLTREELQSEVEAWSRLLREKAGEMGAVQHSLKTTNERLAEPARGDGTRADSLGDPAATEEEKDQQLEALISLEAEQTALIERLRVVLDSFVRKGGDGEAYEKYMAALQHIEVDASGLDATWATVKGWLRSREGGVRLAWRMGAFLAILAATWLIARGVTAVTSGALERSSRLSALAKAFVERSIRNVVMATGFVVAVASLGVSVGPVLAAIGAAGFIVGFALQGTLSNFASGLMILVYRPFDVGDLVEAGGVSGKVVDMNLVSTTFHTFDNQKIIVPNNEIWGNVITNVTANDVRRVDLSFGVAYDADIGRVETILTQCLEEHERVLEDPEPVVKLHELADSAVVFVCRPWVRTEDYWTVYWDLTRTVKRRFDAEGISIPFPQHEIHLRPAEGTAP